MAEKTCSHCVHFGVCEDRFSWLDQEDNTKHIICYHFKDKADVVEVVRCKDCTYWQDNNGGYPHKECRWGKGETPDSNDFCSHGERKSEK